MVCITNILKNEPKQRHFVFLSQKLFITLEFIVRSRPNLCCWIIVITLIYKMHLHFYVFIFLASTNWYRLQFHACGFYQIWSHHLPVNSLRPIPRICWLNKSKLKYNGKYTYSPASVRPCASHSHFSILIFHGEKKIKSPRSHSNIYKSSTLQIVV